MDVYVLRWSNQLLLTAENESLQAQGQPFSLTRFRDLPGPGRLPTGLASKSALGLQRVVLDRQKELVGPPQIVYIHAMAILHVALGHD